MLERGLDFLFSLDVHSMLTVYWWFFLLELPRYLLPSIAVGLQAAFGRAYPNPDPRTPVSVLLVGFNEAEGLLNSVMSLREQTHRNMQIIVVDDGSTDGMSDVATGLRRKGMIDTVLTCSLRGGKVGGLNLALRYAKHEIVLVLDVDTSFDRDAIAQLIAPLVAEPNIGAVSGNLAVRNIDDSLLTRFQALEYYNNISIGRQFTSMMGWLLTVSGAFGAFRRTAINQIGGWDVGPGDDSNITAKIRRAGWRVVFAPHAWALTDVPVSHDVLWRQRLRWNRSLIRNRLRKYATVFNPFNANFSMADMLAALNILYFNVVLCFSFAFFLIYSWIKYGDLVFVIIVSLYIFTFPFKCLKFSVAYLFTGRPGMLRLLPYLPALSLYVGHYMRLNRMQAYLSELIFRRSYRDSYYPMKVHRAQDQF